MGPFGNLLGWSSVRSSSEEKLIAVMGATGSGKSSLISLATGKDVAVGHNLESCTTGIQEVDVQIEGKKVTLIDTPGFDDTNKTDTEVLTAIANYLESNYRKNHHLTGIIFLHRITDNRMGGVSNKNVLMFQKLVGSSALDHVVCCSTMWDRAEESEGEFSGRENQLRERYWANMVANGAQMARHDNTAQSARSVMNKLLNLEPVKLMIQKELVDLQKKLFETHVGMEVNKELDSAAARQKQELQETKARLTRERAENEAKLAREVEQQRRDAERILRDQEQTRARLEAERQKESRRLEALAVEAERKARAASNELERIRLALQSKQRASFGIIISTAYEASNSLHWQRTTSTSGGEKLVSGYWAQIVAKGNWSSDPVAYSVCITYNERYPTLHIKEDIYMYTGYVSRPAFARTPQGELYAGFSKIGTISANMSHLRGHLKSVGENWWKLNYSICLSTQYHQLSAWMEWQYQGATWMSSKQVFDINL